MQIEVADSEISIRQYRSGELKVYVIYNELFATDDDASLMIELEVNSDDMLYIGILA